MRNSISALVRYAFVMVLLTASRSFGLPKEATTQASGPQRTFAGMYINDISGLDKEVGGIQKLFDDAEQQALDLNLLEIQYNRLKRSKDTNEKLYALAVQFDRFGLKPLLAGKAGEADEDGIEPGGPGHGIIERFDDGLSGGDAQAAGDFEARAVARQTGTYDTSVLVARTTRTRCGAGILTMIDDYSPTRTAHRTPARS